MEFYSRVLETGTHWRRNY